MPGGKDGGEKIIREFGIDVYTLLYLKMDNQQGPTTQHRKLLDVTWQLGWEGSLGENGYMYMYDRVPLLSI